MNVVLVGGGGEEGRGYRMKREHVIISHVTRASHAAWSHD